MNAKNTTPSPAPARIDPASGAPKSAQVSYQATPTPARKATAAARNDTTSRGTRIFHAGLTRVRRNTPISGIASNASAPAATITTTRVPICEALETN